MGSQPDVDVDRGCYMPQRCCDIHFKKIDIKHNTHVVPRLGGYGINLLDCFLNERRDQLLKT